jgi:hypothetical protein
MTMIVRISASTRSSRAAVAVIGSTLHSDQRSAMRTSSSIASSSSNRWATVAHASSPVMRPDDTGDRLPCEDRQVNS